MGLTLLYHASLPLQFWGYAFTIVIYLINRLLTTSFNFAIPFVTLSNKDPDFQFLKTFGCACFPLLRPYHTRRLNFHSQEYLSFGYSSSHKGIKMFVFNWQSPQPKDVLFNELRFPYFDLFTLTHISILIPFVVPTPQSSQLYPSHSPSTPSIPPGFSSISANSPLQSPFLSLVNLPLSQLLYTLKH